MKLADECWVALALLHKKQPKRASFSVKEIVDRMRAEHAHPEMRPGVRTHIHQHLVANIPPDTGRYRLFYRLPDGTFRLFKPGDDCHPRRTGKTKPACEDLPARYVPLLDWYETEYASEAHGTVSRTQRESLLSLRGMGKGLWADQDPVEYVRSLRQGWYAENEGDRPPSGPLPAETAGETSKPGSH